MNYRMPWEISFKNALAANTTNIDCMRSFLRKREKSLAYNKSMPEELWWEIAKSKTSAEVAEALASAPLTPARVDYLLSDKRAGVLTTLVSKQVLTPEQVDCILNKPAQYESVIRALSRAQYISVKQARIILSQLDGWYWAQALKAQKVLSDAEVSSMISSIPGTTNRVVLRYDHFLNDILDVRPKLAATLLEDILLKSENWKGNDLSHVLSAIATCRYWESGMSSSIRSIIGERPKPSQQRALILMGVYGNPNSGPEDVVWSGELLKAWDRVLPFDMKEFVSKVERIRSESSLAPVKSKWEEASPEEEKTIKTLRVAGLYSYYSHPRDGVDRTRNYAQDVTFDPLLVGKLPVSLSMGESWDQVNQWREGIVASASYVDEALKGQGPFVWDTLISLSENWQGDIDSLINAAITI